MVYQSFPDEEPGDSNSSQKLSKLYLPPLEDLSVLDIGCNEGFFCFEALKRGAKRAVGIDKNNLVINKAIERARELGLSQSTQFICQDWQQLPNEKFDIVFLFSALHYADDQFKLIDSVMERVNKTGTFILECGIHKIPNTGFAKINRGNDEVLFPSFSLLYKHLSKYGYRLYGKSVKQDGDPIQRWVIHISHKKYFCVLISGPPLSGKTTLAKTISNNNMDVVSLDDLLSRFIRANRDIWGTLDVSKYATQLDVYYEIVDKDIDIRNRYIEIIKANIKEIRSSYEKKSLLFIEGYGLNFNSISHVLTEYLENNGFIIWNLTRPLSEKGEIEKLTDEVIEGWAFSNSQQKTKIEIIADDKLVGITEPHIGRDDVHLRYPYVPINSGFSYEFKKFPKRIRKYKSVRAKFKYEGSELDNTDVTIENSQTESFITKILGSISRFFK